MIAADVGLLAALGRALLQVVHGLDQDGVGQVGVRILAAAERGAVATPHAGVLASGAALGVVGGLISGLVQLGLPHEIATRLGEHVQKGDTLVIAHASSEEEAELAQAGSAHGGPT